MTITFVDMINKSYVHYKGQMIGSDGRALGVPDKDDLDGDGNISELISFSEGASYVAIRTQAMVDRTTFDRSWLWTKRNMQRLNVKQVYNPKTRKWRPLPASKRDHLFVWRYLPSVGGRRGGVLDNKDYDPASDADQDIAAALLGAHQRWGSKGKINYLKEALLILKDIWDKETKVINGKRVMMAGDTQHYTKDPFSGKATVGFNASYFRLYYYAELFAKYDKIHSWISMVAPTKELLARSADATFHDENKRPVVGKINMSPDWFAVDKSFKICDHGWKIGDHVGRKIILLMVMAIG